MCFSPLVSCPTGITLCIVLSSNCVLAVCSTPFAIRLFLTLTFVVSPLPTSTIIFSNAHLNMLLGPTSLRCTVAFFLSLFFLKK